VKLGADNPTKLIAAIVLLVLGLVLFARMITGPSPAAATAPAPKAGAAPAQGRAAPARRTTRGKTASVLAPSLDPRLRLNLLKTSEDTKYEGTGRNIFRAEAPIPKPVASAMKQAPPPPPVYTPPPPPPINLKFFGFASKPGESKKVFLSQGEDVFIAGEGEIVNRRYKVVRIAPNAVEIEDVLSNHRQSIPLTSG
jgi:hypothetical protein